MRTTVRAALGAVVLGLVAGLVGPSAVAAPSPAPSPSATGELQTFGIGPATEDGLDRRGVFVYAGKPGTVIDDQLALVNYTTTPQRVEVYAADAFTSPEGAFDVLAGEQESTRLGSWTDFERRTVTIPARPGKNSAKLGTLVLPFTITVPDNADPGDHAAGFVASVRTDSPTAGSSGVVVDRRVGTRVYLQVPGAASPKLEVTDLRAEYAGTLNPVGTGTTRVSYTVRNTGNTVLSTRQEVRIDPWFGPSPSAIPDDLLQLLPGAAVPITVEIAGTWPTLRPSALVTLSPFTGTTDNPNPIDRVNASTAFWAVPWTLIALIVLLAAAGYGLHRYRRSRRAVPDPIPSAPTEELVSAP